MIETSGRGGRRRGPSAGILSRVGVVGRVIKGQPASVRASRGRRGEGPSAHQLSSCNQGGKRQEED